ncbi:MAG: efflux RND transporter permease subunit, partial [Sphingobacteriales bacterium]
VQINNGSFYLKDKVRFTSDFGYNGERVTFNYMLGKASHEQVVPPPSDLPSEVLISIQKVGWANRDSKKIYGKNYGQVSLVVLGSTEHLLEAKEKIRNAMQSRLQSIEGISWFEVEQSSEVANQDDQILAPIYISGNSLDEVMWAQDLVKEKIKSLPGFVQLQESDDHVEDWQFHFNFDQLLQAGLSVRRIADEVAYKLSPQLLGRIPVLDEITDVKLSSKEFDRIDPTVLRSKLDNLTLRHPIHKELLSLDRFGHWASKLSQTSITKLDGVPSLKLDVEFDQSKINRQVLFQSLAKIADSVQKQKVGLNVKTNVSESKQDEEIQTYLYEIGLACILVFVLVALTTGSYTRPLILIICLSPILAAVIFALYS